MPEAISSRKLVELIPELNVSDGLTDALASLANVAGETLLKLGRLDLTPLQSEELKGIVNRALGKAATCGVELGNKTRQPLELDGLIALNRLVGMAIIIGGENVTPPKTPESGESPQSDPQR